MPLPTATLQAILATRNDEIAALYTEAAKCFEYRNWERASERVADREWEKIPTAVQALVLQIMEIKDEVRGLKAQIKEHVEGITVIDCCGLSIDEDGKIIEKGSKKPAAVAYTWDDQNLQYEPTIPMMIALGRIEP